MYLANEILQWITILYIGYKVKQGFDFFANTLIEYGIVLQILNGVGSNDSINEEEDEENSNILTH